MVGKNTRGMPKTAKELQVELQKRIRKLEKELESVDKENDQQRYISMFYTLKALRKRMLIVGG